MCKYKISLTTSFLLIMLLLFSFGYTYAYFSQRASASATLGVYSTRVMWRDGTTLSLIGNGNTIALKSNLKRGNYTEIQGETGSPIRLMVSYEEETGELASYCRLKLTATYQNSSGQPQDCSQYITLANKSGNLFTKLEDSANWRYENGYYYYKNDSGLIKVENENAISVANYLFLSGEANADIFGASINITLTVEVAQVANEGYKSVWRI